MATSSSLLFPERIGRLSFLVRYMVFLLVVVGAAGLGMLADNADSPVLKIGIWVPVIGIFGFALFCLFRSVLIPRMRDVGMKPIYALVIFVPVINTLFAITLLLWEGETWREKQASRLKSLY